MTGLLKLHLDQNNLSGKCCQSAHNKCIALGSPRVLVVLLDCSVQNVSAVQLFARQLVILDGIAGS